MYKVSLSCCQSVNRHVRFKTEVKLLQSMLLRYSRSCWVIYLWRSFNFNLYQLITLYITLSLLWIDYFFSFAEHDWQSPFFTVLFDVGLSLVEPLMCSSLVSARLAAIFLALAAPYILLSVSYEVLFLMTLTVTLHQWLQVEVGQLTWVSQSLTQVCAVFCV